MAGYKLSLSGPRMVEQSYLENGPGKAAAGAGGRQGTWAASPACSDWASLSFVAGQICRWYRPAQTAASNAGKLCIIAWLTLRCGSGLDPGRRTLSCNGPHT